MTISIQQLLDRYEKLDVPIDTIRDMLEAFADQCYQKGAADVKRLDPNTVIPTYNEYVRRYGRRSPTVEDEIQAMRNDGPPRDSGI